MAARHRLRPGLAATGLHQLDGARYLRDARHADAVLCRLVAHHSCAIIEAGERGLADALSSEFEPAPDMQIRRATPMIVRAVEQVRQRAVQAT